MGKNKATDSYNKDYFTAGGIPQPAAEIVPDEEKAKLSRHMQDAQEGEVELSGPDADPEIARAMGARRKKR
ncbi:MAG: hypothetical protein ACM357_03335 [Gemmatimonadota bacterium]